MLCLPKTEIYAKLYTSKKKGKTQRKWLYHLPDRVQKKSRLKFVRFPKVETIVFFAPTKNLFFDYRSFYSWVKPFPPILNRQIRGGEKTKFPTGFSSTRWGGAKLLRTLINRQKLTKKLMITSPSVQVMAILCVTREVLRRGRPSTKYHFI